MIHLLLIYFFGKPVAEWAMIHVFNAGNVIATLLALVTPFFVRNYFLPYLYHPYRYGGIPFVPPGFFEFQGLYYLSIFGFLTLYYLLSAYMNVYKFCEDCFGPGTPTIFFNITKFLFVLLICFFILVFLPVKVPFATPIIFIPHANELLNGVFWSLFTLFGVTWANLSNIENICGGT